jgi:hypothetical protein
VTNNELTKELTLKEIKEAIAAMPKDKAPGSDGIPTEFFQELVEEISPTLLQAFSAMRRGGGDVRMDQQGPYHADSQIRRPRQDRKLAANHVVGKSL